MIEATRRRPSSSKARTAEVISRFVGAVILAGTVFALLAPASIGMSITERYFSPEWQGLFADLAAHPEQPIDPTALAIFVFGGRLLWVMSALMVVFMILRRTLRWVTRGRLGAEIEEPGIFWSSLIITAVFSGSLFLPGFYEPDNKAGILVIVPQWIWMPVAGCLFWIMIALPLMACIAPGACKGVREGIKNPGTRPLSDTQIAMVAEQLQQHAGIYRPGYRRTRAIALALAVSVPVAGYFGLHATMTHLPIQHLFKVAAIICALFAAELWRTTRKVREVRVSQDGIAIDPAGIRFDAGDIERIEFRTAPKAGSRLEFTFSTLSHSMNTLFRAVSSNGHEHRVRIEN